MPQPGEHLDAIGFDPLTRAPPIPLLAAAQISVDRLALEVKARRETAQDGDERGAVGLAGSGEGESHGSNPTARRITSIGAPSPVHSSKAAAP